MGDNIIKFFILLSVISYLGAGILFLFNQNFQNWGFGSLLIIGLLVTIVEVINLFNKKFEIFNQFTILDSYQKWILEILIWFSPLLFMIYYSFYSSDFKISGMLGNLAGGVLLTGLLIMIVEVTTFLSKQKPRIVASLVNGIYKMLFFLKDKGYYKEIHKLSGEINDLLGDKINKNLKIDLIPKENSQENFVTHAKSYLNFAYFCGAVLFDEKLEDISRLRFEKLDLTEQKKEIFERIKQYKNVLNEIENLEKINNIKNKCEEVIEKLSTDDEFQKTLFELANNFMDNDSMLSIREKRQIQNILYLKNAEILKDKGENVKNTFQFIVGFYLIFDYYLDKLAYYGEDIKENIERKEDKKTSNVIMKFIEPLKHLKHFVTTDSYWRTKIIEIGIYLGIGLVLLVILAICNLWGEYKFSEFWQAIGDNILYGIFGLIITILVALKDEVIPYRKDIPTIEIKNLPIWENLSTRLSLDENAKILDKELSDEDDENTFISRMNSFKAFNKKFEKQKEEFNELKQKIGNRNLNKERIENEIKLINSQIDEFEKSDDKLKKVFERQISTLKSFGKTLNDTIKGIEETPSQDFEEAFEKTYSHRKDTKLNKFASNTELLSLTTGWIVLTKSNMNYYIKNLFSNNKALNDILYGLNSLDYRITMLGNIKGIDATKFDVIRKRYNSLLDSLSEGKANKSALIGDLELSLPKVIGLVKSFNEFSILINEISYKITVLLNINFINEIVDAKTNFLDRGYYSQDPKKFDDLMDDLNLTIYSLYSLLFEKDMFIKASLLGCLIKQTQEGAMPGTECSITEELTRKIGESTIGYDIGFLPFIESFEEHGIPLDKMLVFDCNNGFRRLSELITRRCFNLLKEEFYILFEEEIKKEFFLDDCIVEYVNGDNFKEEFSKKIGVSKDILDKIMETFKKKLRTSYNNYYK